MKKFNLFNEIIVMSKNELLQAINSGKIFAVNTHGKVVFPPYTDNEILIYEGAHSADQNIGIVTPKPLNLETALGKDLKVVVDDERVLIKAAPAWQNIIKLNVLRASYDDTTGDGISEFSNKDLEDLGWHATEFNISYRELVELLEESCEGTLICIEQKEPYQFSGLGFITDNKKAYEILYNYSQEKVKYLIQNDEDFAKENLTDDELEAAEYFKAV
ncbi:hypothetical protein KKA17_10790 [bacterium]|nr:hypothetical protein [bacterium]MBU1883877.1 hypothetical protein [bacterium]